ncbi:MAG: hypothetical protein Q7K65_03730 [Candidatus Buchananbacteria bacterium]|nr:hypothetical protein [Candidatus Buchananbacteria bacterium]
MKRTLIFGVIGLFLALPMIVLAIGQTTNPIIIDNALRGGEFQETLIIINNDGENVEVKLSVEGQTASWTKFYLPGDLKNPIESFSLEKDGQANIVVVFSVPQDTANGDYIGFVGAGKKVGTPSENKNESSVSVEQKINREVKIKVTDKETIKLLVSVIPETFDVKSGENLSVRFIYDNQSNVALKPQIQFRIRKADQTVYNAIFPYPDGDDPVRSLAQHEISALKIPTTGLADGKYLAEIEFLHNGQAILSQNFKFSIVSGSVLGAYDINLTNYWVSVPLGLVIVAILVVIFLIIGHKRKNKIGGQAV